MPPMSRFDRATITRHGVRLGSRTSKSERSSSLRSQHRVIVAPGPHVSFKSITIFECRNSLRKGEEKC